MEEGKQKNLAIEEDDELEEFEQEDWNEQMEDEADVALWEEDWEEEDPNEEFTRHLREQLTKP